MAEQQKMVESVWKVEPRYGMNQILEGTQP